MQPLSNCYATGIGVLSIIQLNSRNLLLVQVSWFLYNKKASKDYDGKRNNHKLKDDDEIIRNEGGCPQIISNELWDKVQKRLNDDKHKLYSTRHYYLLKDKIYCGECGEKMGGNHKPSGTNKKRYTTYDCNGRRRKSGCKNKGINASYDTSMVYISKLAKIYNDVSSDNNSLDYLSKLSEPIAKTIKEQGLREYLSEIVVKCCKHGSPFLKNDILDGIILCNIENDHSLITFDKAMKAHMEKYSEERPTYKSSIELIKNFEKATS